MYKPKFSILVPVYNVEDYLEECILSVINQSCKDYELILVDDGSTDRSGKICDEYSEKHSNIKVCHKPNGGLIHTRRFALNLSCGDYIVHLDSDDFLETNALEILKEKISEHYCDCVFFNRRLYLNGKFIEPTYHINEGYFNNKRIINRIALIDLPYNGIVLKCAKRELYGGYDYSNYYHISSGEDLLQSVELLDNCNSAEFIDNTLYNYRVRSGSIINSSLSSGYRIDYTVREYVLRYLIDTSIFSYKDMNDYRDKCIRLFINEIIKIAYLNTDIRSKIELFHQIRKTDYFNNFLKKGINDKKNVGNVTILYDLFISKYYKLIILIVYIKKKLDYIFSNSIFP